jgi:predicted  nucleic acid-binding Zn-ribbon protein
MIDNLNLKNRIKNNWYSIIVTIAFVITLLNYLELKNENNNLNNNTSKFKKDIRKMKSEQDDIENENENLQNENEELKENYNVDE